MVVLLPLLGVLGAATILVQAVRRQLLPCPPMQLADGGWLVDPSWKETPSDDVNQG